MNTVLPQMVAFDLDDTLAPSKQPLPSLMATRLRELLDHCEVCVISGGDTEQFQTQLLDNLHASDEQLKKLHLMPTCGTKYLRYQDCAWKLIYSHELPTELAQKALRILEEQARCLGVWESETWGPILENRGSQITFSALGQQAPVAAKTAWDKDGSKREALRSAVAQLLPELEVRAGGSTSVDITRHGIDKAYGMEQLVEHSGIAKENTLFIGDRLDEGGNDRPVLDAGWKCLAVTSWEETAQVISKMIAT